MNVGTGYVGLVTGACMAQMGNSYFALMLTEKIDEPWRGVIPIYERLNLWSLKISDSAH